MATNPFQAPGEDMLRQMAGTNPSGADCILVKPNSRGVGGFARKVREDRKKVEKEEEPGEAYIPLSTQSDESAKKEGSVVGPEKAV